jgi:hypothetical protein
MIVKTLKEIVRQEISALFESAESDFEYVKEARRVYNKIVKNINNINFVSTSEEDFIKDTNGNAHRLYGVKFNLSQLDEKYDLDILLVHELGMTSHHYSKNNNRIVFFILSQTNKEDFNHNLYLAKIRFHSWVEEPTFTHEFIHFLDSKRYSPTYKFSKPAERTDYYNSPEEYNAFTQEIILNINKNKKQFQNITFKEFLKNALKKSNWEFVKKLNDAYKNKLVKRLYKIYTELNYNQTEK